MYVSFFTFHAWTIQSIVSICKIWVRCCKVYSVSSKLDSNEHIQEVGCCNMQ